MRPPKKAVIPAAGYGTRFLPLTKSVPKELLPIGSRPAIQYVVEEAVASGINEIILVCNPAKLSIEDYFKPDPRLRSFLKRKGKTREIAELDRVNSMASIEVVYQKEPRGLGHSVWCARQAVGDEPFVVMLPDMLVLSRTPAVSQLTASCRHAWGLLVQQIPRNRISSYGIIDFERSGNGHYRLRGAVEKPRADDAPSRWGILGRYLLPPEIFEVLGSLKAEGEIQLTEALDRLTRFQAGIAVKVEGKVFDIGTPEGLRNANRYF